MGNIVGLTPGRNLLKTIMKKENFKKPFLSFKTAFCTLFPKNEMNFSLEQTLYARNDPTIPPIAIPNPTGKRLFPMMI